MHSYVTVFFEFEVIEYEVVGICPLCGRPFVQLSIYIRFEPLVIATLFCHFDGSVCAVDALISVGDQ